MAKYLARSCPRCNGYLGIVLREPGRNVPLQAVNGHCLGCGYRIWWIVIRGRQRFHRKGDARAAKQSGVKGFGEIAEE